MNSETLVVLSGPLISVLRCTHTCVQNIQIFSMKEEREGWPIFVSYVYTKHYHEILDTRVGTTVPL